MPTNEVQERPAPSMLAIWHDVAPGMADEFETWHSRQHLPERVTIPGIRLARRYRRVSEGGEDYCTVLTIDDTGVLRSDEYLRRLNAPTPWTVKVSGSYMNFFRCAVSPSHASVAGRAAFLVSVRVDVDRATLSRDAVNGLWRDLTSEREATPAWSLVIGLVEGAATSTRTSETTARNRTAEAVTDLVAFAELSDLDRAERFRRDALRHVQARFDGARAASACYQLQFEIDDSIGAKIFAENLKDVSQYPEQAQEM